MIVQPHKLLLLTGILLIVLSLFVFRKTFDIHLHDTYYVMALHMVYWTLAAVVLLFALLYWWTSKMLFSGFLTWTHVILTIFSAFFIVTAPFWLQVVEHSFPGDPLSAIEQKWRFYRNLQIFCLFLLAGQLIFFINLVRGVINR